MSLSQLRAQRRILSRRIHELAYAVGCAQAQGLLTEPDLRETLQARLCEREALDLAIASYDAQQGLFPDDHYAVSP